MRVGSHHSSLVRLGKTYTTFVGRGNLTASRISNSPKPLCSAGSNLVDRSFIVNGVDIYFSLHHDILEPRQLAVLCIPEIVLFVCIAQDKSVILYGFDNWTQSVDFEVSR